MTENVVLKVQNLKKVFQVFDRPSERLKEIFSHYLPGFLRPNRAYCKRFVALESVNFKIHKGETVGVVGKNGSGKSTLLQIICGTLAPSKGTVFAQGRIVALLELGSGFNPHFTGRENIYLNCILHGLNHNQISERFNDIVKFAELEKFLDQTIGTYSSGMAMRLAFSVAVHTSPDVFIVDEALSVGDEFFQRKCFAKLDEMRARGVTILFVSHSAAQVIELCDRAILLDEGRMLKIGPAKDVVRSYQKLLYAPPAAREKVIEEIVSDSVKSKDLTNEGQIHALGTGLELRSGVGCENDEGYDLGLRPTTTTEYESHGPIIASPEVLTPDGRKVNLLVRGKSYHYRYEVRFEKPATFVRFGMSIKTLSGYSLGGAQTETAEIEGSRDIVVGTIVIVEFTFCCNLNPGLYFMNAGVVGNEHGEQTVLHRLVDALAFRVLPIKGDCQNGDVDLKVSAIVSKI